nr:hypothetical protein JVH1_8876 [Rhodococcus sp. JVH1]
MRLRKPRTEVLEAPVDRFGRGLSDVQCRDNFHPGRPPYLLADTPDCDEPMNVADQ